MSKIIRLVVLLAFLLALFAPSVSADGAFEMGSPATNRAFLNGKTTVNTLLTGWDPATGTGIITSVEIWFSAQVTGVKVGSFYRDSGTEGGNGNFTCRDYATLGTVPAGFQTYSGLSIDVEAGDLLGYTWVGQADRGLEMDRYSLFPYYENALAEDAFDMGSHAFGVSSSGIHGNYWDYEFSVHAVGYTVASAEPSPPFGVAIDATDVTAFSATLNALCVSDGGGNTTALFMYGCPVQDGNVTHAGYLTDGEYFSGNATDLIPSQTYGFWVVFTNEYGEYWTTPVVFFNTEDTSGYSVPLVVTNPLNPALDVGETSARLYGYLSYDGNLDCQTGFQYRVDGSGTWLAGWNSGIYHTGSAIRGDLTNLQTHTTYEYRAIAQNAMSVSDNPSYGVTLEFTTSYYAPTPPGGGGLPGIPVVWREWFDKLGATAKSILALLITIAGMIAIAIWLDKSKGGGIVVGAFGGLSTIGFIIVGWYPLWVAFLIGAVVALIVFLLLLGRRG